MGVGAQLTRWKAMGQSFRRLFTSFPSRTLCLITGRCPVRS